MCTFKSLLCWVSRYDYGNSTLITGVSQMRLEGQESIHFWNRKKVKEANYHIEMLPKNNNFKKKKTVARFMSEHGV